MFKRILKWILILLLSIIVLYGLGWGVYGRLVYSRFYSLTDKVHTIPGLFTGFTPQGVTYVEKDGTLLVCGYMSGSSPSRIYRIDEKGDVTLIKLQKEDGSAYTGHAGGLTAAGEYVYVSNANKIFILSLADILSAKDGSSVSFLGDFPVPCRSSYCSSYDGMLYVGEYHHVGYSTDESHRLETASGTYQAMTFGYKLDKDGKAETEPCIAYATPDKVQGFAVMDGMAAVSTSAGFAPSHVKVYDTNGTDGVFLQDGKEIPLIVLDAKREKANVLTPHMSEDLEYRDGKLYLGFEGGAAKFAYGLVPGTVRSVRVFDASRF